MTSNLKKCLSSLLPNFNPKSFMLLLTVCVLSIFVWYPDYWYIIPVSYIHAVISSLFAGADILQHQSEVLGSCRPHSSCSYVLAELRDRHRHRPVCASETLQEESQVSTAALRCVKENNLMYPSKSSLITYTNEWNNIIFDFYLHV